jgi:hypothetical protein
VRLVHTHCTDVARIQRFGVPMFRENDRANAALSHRKRPHVRMRGLNRRSFHRKKPSFHPIPQAIDAFTPTSTASTLAVTSFTPVPSGAS